MEHIQQAVEEIYHFVQRLWDAIPLPTVATATSSISTNSDGAAAFESDEFNVHAIMVESCVGKATSLARELLELLTSTKQPKPKPALNKKRTVSSSSSLVDFGTVSQASIARVLELTLRLTFESMAAETKRAASAVQESCPSTTTNEEAEEVTIHNLTQLYTAYQRQLLRSRSKPSIAHVAEIRKLAVEQQMSVAELVQEAILNDLSVTEENDEGAPAHHQQQQQPNREEQQERKRPHATAITVILGESSSLIHPLVLWRNGILESQQEENQQGRSSSTYVSPQLENERKVQSALLFMCHDSTSTLYKEAEMLSMTVGNWFIADTTFPPSPSSSSSLPNHYQDNASKSEDLNLTLLDGTLDQMAFICQVISRFCTFSQQSDVETSITTASASAAAAAAAVKSTTTTTTNSNNQNLSTHLLEQSLHYSTTEPKLTNANLQRALSLAKPVQKIIGSQLYVPSIVEHAYYISKRAMERASGTMSDRTIWTVAHWVCLLCSMEEEHHHGGDVATGYRQHQEAESTAAVYSALMQQKGCVVVVVEQQAPVLENNKPLNKDEQKKSSSNFRNALLDAFDQDLVKDGKAMKNKKAPSSGSMLSKENMALVHQINSQCCTLNGIHAASSACNDLANFFESLLPEDNEGEEEGQELNSQKGTNMIQFARRTYFLFKILLKPFEGANSTCGD